MSTTTLTSKGQMTLPKGIRDRLHLGTGDRLEVIAQEDGTVLLIPATVPMSRLKGCLPPPPRALSLEEIDEVIRERAAVRGGGER